MRKILILLLLPLFSYSQFSYKGHEYDVEKILKSIFFFSSSGLAIKIAFLVKIYLDGNGN